MYNVSCYDVIDRIRFNDTNSNSNIFGTEALEPPSCNLASTKGCCSSSDQGMGWCSQPWLAACAMGRKRQKKTANK